MAFQFHICRYANNVLKNAVLPQYVSLRLLVSVDHILHTWCYFLAIYCVQSKRRTIVRLDQNHFCLWLVGQITNLLWLPAPECNAKLLRSF